MQILISLYFQNVFKRLFHDKMQNPHYFILMNFASCVKGGLLHTAVPQKSARGPHFFGSIVISIFQSIK